MWNLDDKTVHDAVVEDVSLILYSFSSAVTVYTPYPYTSFRNAITLVFLPLPFVP